MNPLFRYFARQIIIDLHVSQFTFSIKNKVISNSFAPYLYLRKDDSMWMPIAIGEEIPQEQSAELGIHKIELFNSQNEILLDTTLNKADLIQILFEYGIGRCFEKFWLPQLRPVVFILGADRFKEHFECPKEIFEKAARLGGAAMVVFDQTELLV